MLKNEIKEVLSQGNTKEYKKFGITMGIVMLLISAYLYWQDYSSLIYFLVTGLVLFIAAFVLPKSLKYLYNIWMTFAAIMGFIMSRVILSILFFLLFTPVGLFTRLIRKDLLKKRWDKGANSYWILRDNKEDYAENTL